MTCFSLVIFEICTVKLAEATKYIEFPKLEGERATVPHN